MAAVAPEGLDRLLALEDIRLLRTRYCRWIDGRWLIGSVKVAIDLVL